MEEKKKLNVKIIIIFLVLVMIAIGVIINIKVNVTDPSIEFYTLVSPAINDYLPRKYKITNKEDVELFSKLQGLDFDDKYDLSKNTIFVQIQPCGSRMIKLDFKRVKIDEDVEFKYSLNVPKGALTQDMAYWYLIAIVPNEKLNGVNTDDWESLIEVNNRFITEYTVKMESETFDLIGALNIIKKELTNIGNINLISYSEEIDNDLTDFGSDSVTKRYYSFLSYDEEAARTLVSNINNMNIDLKASFYSTEKYMNNYSDIKSNENQMNYEVTLRAKTWKELNIESIIDILKPDETSRRGSQSNGRLSCIFYNSSLERYEETIKNIKQYEKDWNLGYTYVDVNWK